MELPIPAFISPEPDVDYATLEYDQQIQHTQRLKSRLLHRLATQNPDGSLPTDKDAVELILKVADSMDKTTLSNKRNNVDEANGNSNAEILRALAQMTFSNGNKNPMMSDGGGSTQRRPEAEIDPADLGEFSHTEGEAFTGVVAETVDNFTKRMTLIAEEQRREDEKALGLDT